MVNTFSQMMPLVIATMQAFTTCNEDHATECFELLDELCENLNAVIAPHVKSLVNMCLAIATNKSLDDSLRVKAVGFIGWLARTKKKALVKHKLVEPIVGKCADALLFQQSVVSEKNRMYTYTEIHNTIVVYSTCRHVIRTHDYTAR